MPHYFFDFLTVEERVPDGEGVEAPRFESRASSRHSQYPADNFRSSPTGRIGAGGWLMCETRGKVTFSPYRFRPGRSASNTTAATRCRPPLAIFRSKFSANYRTRFTLMMSPSGTSPRRCRSRAMLGTSSSPCSTSSCGTTT